MSRVQLALNVTDINAAVAFYAKLFKTEPAKRKPGYANFAIDEPALKLVLIENPAAPGTLNHLGVEVFSTAEVAAAQRRLEDDGLATADESGVCCYAQQEKVWVNDPDGAPWEIYTVLADSDTAGTGMHDPGNEAAMCGAGACATRELADVTAGEVSVKGCCCTRHSSASNWPVPTRPACALPPGAARAAEEWSGRAVGLVVK